MAPDTRTARLEISDLDERGDWWNFERLSRWDATHPAAAWAAQLLQEAATIRLPCPRCSAVASVRTNLDHLLRDHGAGYAEVAAWLEEADADLFSLAVHYLATKARATRPPVVRGEASQFQGRSIDHGRPAEGQRSPRRGLLPGWCASHQ